MKLMRYFFVGGLAAVVDFTLFVLLTKYLHVAWFWSAIISFTAATLANYVLSVRFVFKSGARFSRKHHEMMLVFLVSLIGLSINQLVLWLCIEEKQMKPLIAKIVGTGVVFFWNYAARRYFVFKPQLARSDS